MDKAWQDDKRAWIFYWDQLQNDKNFVCGETEKERYAFDCETAHLLLWVKEWDTFTEVGISNLLKELREYRAIKNSKEIFHGTRILYKGIELQEKCKQYDAEFLEYIDIKKELKREYIRINRNGFTESGQLFFQKQLYPQVLESVKNALRDMEIRAVQDNEEEKHDFYTIMKNILQEKCTRVMKNTQGDQYIASIQKLTALIASAAVLSYFAVREEWNVWELMGRTAIKDTKEKSWRTVPEMIEEMLSKYPEVLKILREHTALFRIQCISQKLNMSIEKSKRSAEIQFHQLFMENRHYAILQEREDKYSQWELHLIYFDDHADNVYKEIEDVPHKDVQNIEKWGDNLCNLSQAFLPTNDQKQQIVLRWLLKNMPTIAMFCDHSGNVRVNILSQKIAPSIFLSDNFKYLILDRMMQVAELEGVERFSVFTWQNQECISLKELPYSIFFVRRGYLSPYSYHKTIVPLNGSWFRYWKQNIANNNLVECLRRLLSDMDVMQHQSIKLIEQKKSEQSSENIGKGMERSTQYLETATLLLDILKQQISDLNYEPSISFEVLLEKEHDWTPIYDKIVKKYSDFLKTGKNITKAFFNAIRSEKNFEELCAAWFYCGFGRKKDILKEKSKTRELYKEYLNNHPENSVAEKNMLRYMESHLCSPIPFEQLSYSMEQFKGEILSLMEKQEMYDAARLMGEFQKKYQFF